MTEKRVRTGGRKKGMGGHTQGWESLSGSRTDHLWVASEERVGHRLRQEGVRAGLKPGKVGSFYTVNYLRNVSSPA